MCRTNRVTLGLDGRQPLVSLERIELDNSKIWHLTQRHCTAVFGKLQKVFLMCTNDTRLPVFTVTQLFPSFKPYFENFCLYRYKKKVSSLYLSLIHIQMCIRDRYAYVLPGTLLEAFAFIFTYGGAKCTHPHGTNGIGYMCTLDCTCVENCREVKQFVKWITANVSKRNHLFVYSTQHCFLFVTLQRCEYRIELEKLKSHLPTPQSKNYCLA